MFVQDANDHRRVRIIDISHILYRYMFSQAPDLSVTIWLGGQLTTVSTKVPALVTKSLFRWSYAGAYPMLCAFDSAGSTKCRKAYFRQKSAENGVVAPSGGYKASRASQSDSFYKQVEMTRELLMKGGMNCIAYPGYEADDIIKAAVDRAKIDYPHLPIDVFTGDADLLPLVDDQVSVWYYSKKGTYAQAGLEEVRSYIQVTPQNYQTTIEGLTACKGLAVPYNTLLLTKLLRGDKSDEIPAYPKFTPTMYNNLIKSMQADGVDIANLFRYGVPEKQFVNKATGQLVPLAVAQQMPKEALGVVYKDSVELQTMLSVLSKYLDESKLQHIRTVYNGINLNGAFYGLPDGFNRNPMVLTTPITGFPEQQMRTAAYDIFKINLPML